jgi:hypothetical protein
VSINRRDFLGQSGRLWLRGAENLKEDALARVLSMMDAYAPLFEAWLLKELLRDHWEFRDRAAGERFLDGWLEMARATACLLRPAGRGRRYSGHYPLATDGGAKRWRKSWLGWTARP